MMKVKSVYSEDGKLLHRIVEKDEPSSRLAERASVGEPSGIRTVVREEKELYHKIGGLLNRIIGYAELIAEGAVEPEQVHEFAAIIRENGRELNATIHENRLGGFTQDIRPVKEKEPEKRQARDEANNAKKNVGVSRGRKLALVVDDDKATHVILKSWLEGIGYSVLGADSLSEATEILGNYSPQIIFSDYQFPCESAEDFLEIQKAKGTLENKVLVSISGTSPDELKGSYVQHFDANLSKPFSKKTFNEIMQKLTLEEENKVKNESSKGKRQTSAEVDEVYLVEWEALREEERSLLDPNIFLGNVLGILSGVEQIQQSATGRIMVLERISQLARTFEIEQLRTLGKRLINKHGTRT